MTDIKEPCHGENYTEQKKNYCVGGKCSAVFAEEILNCTHRAMGMIAYRPCVYLSEAGKCLNSEAGK